MKVLPHLSLVNQCINSLDHFKISRLLKHDMSWNRTNKKLPATNLLAWVKSYNPSQQQGDIVVWSWKPWKLQMLVDTPQQPNSTHYEQILTQDLRKKRHTQHWPQHLYLERACLWPLPISASCRYLYGYSRGQIGQSAAQSLCGLRLARKYQKWMHIDFKMFQPQK